MPRGTSYTILLIEPDTSLRRLIALGLEHRGIQVVKANSLAALANQPIADPDLLVLDIDNGYHDDASLLTTVQAHPYLATLPMVVLTWDPAQPISQGTTLPLLEYLTKPFDARLLQATIENLLVTSSVISRAARRGSVAATTASTISSASFSPMFTATGLLLTVIGLMLLQPLIVGTGLLVVLSGLLWWTLGKRPERQILLSEVNQKYAPSFQ